MTTEKPGVINVITPEALPVISACSNTNSSNWLKRNNKRMKTIIPIAVKKMMSLFLSMED
ncbi:MAG: hypothetical protein WBL44_12130 [Nitrososphaeraceae archaeon]|jgi:hypothetical protein